MIENLCELIEDSKTVAISGHVRPDGDCVGSTLAMYNYIIDNYKTRDVFLILDPIPNIFKFLKNSDCIIDGSQIDKDTQFDLFIALDCSDSYRMNEYAQNLFKNAKKTVCIDHHFSNGDFADVSYIIPDASSTCELVFNQLGVENISKEIAECLYVGIIHDTGVFQYSCTTASTMNAAGCLMQKGIDFPKIVNDTFFVMTDTENKMLAEAMLKNRFYHNGLINASVITKEDMQKHNALPKHLDSIAPALRSTKDVEVAVFLYQLDDGSFKGSTRASGDVDLTKVCGAFGGGGHKKAAGFSIETNDPWATIEEVVKLIEEQFKELGID